MTSSTQQDFRARFADQGYVHVPALGVTTDDLDRTREVLDRMFDRFATIPRQFAHDLGGGVDPESPVLPEINAVSTLAPELRRTPVFRAALRLATSLLGPGTHLVYDHAIYKPPGLAGTTSWHQDSGYDDELETRLAIWIPFQDTAVADGCMRYVPRSHAGGRRKHSLRTTADGKTVKYLDVANGEAVDVPCDAGGATVHDFHTIHGAGPNVGSNTRKAWIMDFTTSKPVGHALWWLKDKAVARKYSLR